MKYVAAIDVGSHELSMTVAQIYKGKNTRILERVSRTISAGLDTYRLGRISSGVVKQIIEVLLSFKRKLKEYPQVEICAAATSAFREASNQAFVIDRIHRETGIEVEVLSNNEEIAYYFSSLTKQLPEFSEEDQEPCLVLGLGSGSIQLSRFENAKLMSTQNMKMGSLRLRSLLSQLAENSRNYSKLLLEFISGDLEYYQVFEAKSRSVNKLIVIGTGLQYFRRLGEEVGEGLYSLSKTRFISDLDELKKADAHSWVTLEQVPIEQASLVLPTALVLEELFAFTSLESAIIASASLENGLILEMARAFKSEKAIRDLQVDRMSIAFNLAERFRADLDHCEAVRKLTLSFFDQAKKIHRLGNEDRELIELASVMHNIGKYVSMEEDDLRSYEVVSSAELPGLSPSRQNILALLVYFHNGHITHSHPLISKLSNGEKLCLYKLASIMTISNSLDSSHRQKIKELRLRIQGDELLISLHSKEEIELELWNARRHSELFEEVFGLNIKFIAKELA